jgi:hypothetical protein
MYVFGSNSYGELGINNNIFQTIPILNPYVNEIVDIHLGQSYSIIGSKNGIFYSTGLNSNGQLGNGNSIDSNNFQSIQINNFQSNQINYQFHTTRFYSIITTKNTSICNNIDQFQNKVCSGNGYCSNDQCECYYEYYGINCEYTKCHGVFSNESRVCSSNGECIEPNKCQCQKGYYGDNCDSYSCYEIQYSNSSVCSGKGNCILPNKCECHTVYIKGLNCESCLNGYSGKNCSFPDCFGTSQEEYSTVCSGRGNCTYPDNCKCNNDTITGNNCESCIFGRKGNQCHLLECNGILSNEINSCSGNGQCEEGGICK